MGDRWKKQMMCSGLFLATNNMPSLLLETTQGSIGSLQVVVMVVLCSFFGCLGFFLVLLFCT